MAGSSPAMTGNGCYKALSFAPSGPVAGIAAGHADMNLVALANRQRGRGDGRFERRLLGREITLDIAVVEHAPAIAHRDDGILRKSHSCLLLRARVVGFDVLAAL